MDTLFPWIAIVDDEAGIRRALLRLMRSTGIPAQAYASGAELLAALPAGNPCCIVLDIHMPGQSGLELQAELARLAPGVAVIVMTGHDTPEEKALALRLGAHSYLLKPVAAQLLFDSLSSACPSLGQP